MRKLITILIAFFSFAIIGCSNLKNEASQSEELTDQDLKAIYDSASGTTLKPDAVPKYEESKSTLTNKSQDFSILTSVVPSTCILPTSIGSLNSGVDFKIYKFDQSLNASAAAMGFSGSIDKKQMLFVQDFVRYDYIECNGKKQKVGIGLRCFIYVTSFKGKLGYTTLPGIAANVELGRAKASFELKALGFGVDGSVLAEGLQPQGDYTVENFGKLAVVFNNVLKLLNSNSTMTIKPVEFPNS